MKFIRGEEVRSLKTKNHFRVRKTMEVDGTIMYHCKQDDDWHKEEDLINGEEHRQKKLKSGQLLGLDDYGREEDVMAEIIEMGRTELFAKQLKQEIRKAQDRKAPLWIRFLYKTTGIRLSGIYHKLWFYFLDK